MQYNIKNILQSGEKVAVHVPTEDEAREVERIREKEDVPWDVYGKKTCISLQGDNRIEDVAYYTAMGYTIIPASLFIQHNTPKVEKKPFAVKADSFELYERFVKECEGMGWEENDGVPFRLHELTQEVIKNNETIIKFDKNGYWIGASSNISYHLETQYSEAIAAAKAWFEGEEVKPEENKYKALHETISKEAERLQSLLRNTERELSELKTQVKLLLKHNKDQHDRNNAKLMAVSILLSSSMSPDNFAVDCIKQHIDELIEKEYDEPGALPF